MACGLLAGLMAPGVVFGLVWVWSVLSVYMVWSHMVLLHPSGLESRYLSVMFLHLLAELCL